MRVLMTIDAVGGVWRYGVDLARGLGTEGITCQLAVCEPAPSLAQQQECCDLRNVSLTWTELPLDWMVGDAAALDDAAGTLAAMACDWGADLLHLNLPSQAAGLPNVMPVVVTAHSCLATWWCAVKGSELPQDLCWQRELTARGIRRADAVMVPTASHGMAMIGTYGALNHLHIVANATTLPDTACAKQPFVFAAGRWWDEGKNVATVDAVAGLVRWPLRLAGALEGPNVPTVALHHAQALGPLTQEATREQMRGAAIFFSPALYEPFGLAVLEAAAHGCALVLSDIPTFRELWSGAALFIAPHCAAGFAATIARLMNAPSERQALGQRAAARASDFALGRQAEQVRQVYSMTLIAAVPAA